MAAQHIHSGCNVKNEKYGDLNAIRFHTCQNHHNHVRSHLLSGGRNRAMQLESLQQNGVQKATRFRGFADKSSTVFEFGAKAHMLCAKE